MPIFGVQQFKIKYNLYKQSPGRDLHNYLNTGLGDLYIEFGHISEEEISRRYKITSITLDWDGSSGGLDDAYYYIRTEKPLGPDVNFICDDPTGLDPTKITDGTIVRFYKYEVINAAQFDGRFFVKIFMDDTFRRNIEKTFMSDDEYRIVEEEMIYYMREDWFEQHTMHMNWWFTTFYQDSERDTLGYIGSRKHDSTGPYHTASKEYGYTNREDNNNNFGLGGANWDFGDIWQLMMRGPVMNVAEGGNSFLSGGGVAGGNHPDNIDSVSGLGFCKEYGHYGNDKFLASALYFRRFKFYPDYWYSDVLTYKGLSYDVQYNLRWSHVTYDGGGDKRDGGNWSFVPWLQCEMVEGIGSHFNIIDDTGSGYEELVQQTESRSPYTHDTAFQVTKDAAVWFIDDGRAQGLRTTNNTMALNSTSWTNGWVPIHENNYSCNKSGDAGGPKGIRNRSSSDNHDLYLSYGGIFGMEGTKQENYDNFFGISNWNQTVQNPWYNDSALNNFTEKLNPGYRYRWREDPTSTIYAIGPKIRERNWVNHSTRNGSDNGASFSGMIKLHQSSNMPFNMDPAISHNYRKGFIVGEVTPAVTAWDPLYDGMIPNGLNFNLTICNVNGSTTDGNNVTTGSRSGPDGDWATIYVTSLAGDDPVYGIRKLHEGMALRRFKRTSDDTWIKIKDISGYDSSGDIHKGNDYLVVTRIIPHPSSQNPEYYELRLGGYNFPMQDDCHSWLQGSATTDHPKVGSSYNFVQVGMNGHNSNTEFNINEGGFESGAQINGEDIGKMGAVGYKIQFVDDIVQEEILSENPAIWETEPKESKDLDIYHEVTGAIPFNFDSSNVHEAFPIGTMVETNVADEFLYVHGYRDEQLVLTTIATTPDEEPTKLIPSGTSYYLYGSDMSTYFPNTTWSSSSTPKTYHVTTPSGLYFGIRISNAQSGGRLTVEPRLYNANYSLPWFNCYSFGNGVESNRIRDNYNQPYLLNGVKASTTLDQDYKEERRKYGLIYSGIYNSVAGVNDLNQFIQAEKITKDINPIYGSIQKLHSRDSDLVTLCEDKILKIQANKDALFNADGNTNVTASDKVLGQAIPFSGEYGISTNPESFASEAYRAYFSDRVRGKILRLSQDGLTPISDQGMTDWFKDNLGIVRGGKIIGSYDDRNDEYNIKIENKQNATDVEFESTVVSYNERVKGWVSFKSFIEMQHAVSMANDYYTFFNGDLYKHYDEDQDRNTFYNRFEESSIDVVLNDNPAIVKVFNTLNYEGSQSKITQFAPTTPSLPFQPSTTYSDQDIYNLSNKEGWYVDNVVTNKETGEIVEFVEKEGKFYNAINKVVDINALKADTADFTFQGIGIVGTDATVTGGTTVLCPVPSIQLSGQPAAAPALSIFIPAPVQMNAMLGGYDEYNWTFTSPNGTITTGTTGTLTSVDYAGILSNGSGTWTLDVTFEWIGITSCTSSVTFDVILGCSNPNASNYDPLVNVDDGSCAVTYGCTDPNASNYNPAATMDDGSCVYVIDRDDDLGPSEDVDLGVKPLVVPTTITEAVIEELDKGVDREEPVEKDDSDIKKEKEVEKKEEEVKKTKEVIRGYEDLSDIEK